jgi:hypothetical protein
MLLLIAGTRGVVSSPCLHHFGIPYSPKYIFPGHFERRISFGYDADLGQVRAEFDGVMLRIVVPRRASPVEWNPPPRLAPFGRT